MDVHGKDIQMETRTCRACPATFRVMVTSNQHYCGNICRSRETGEIPQYFWSQESNYAVRPPKADIIKIEDE